MSGRVVPTEDAERELLAAAEILAPALLVREAPQLAPLITAIPFRCDYDPIGGTDGGMHLEAGAGRVIVGRGFTTGMSLDTLASFIADCLPDILHAHADAMRAALRGGR